METTFMLKLTNEMKRRIEKMAFEKRISQAEVVRRAIKKFLEEENVTKMDWGTWKNKQRYWKRKERK